MDPAGQAYPATQLPLHTADVKPVLAPKLPAGHGVQDPAPAREYCPAGQMDAVGDVDPATHAYPAVQLPEQDAVVRPVEAPYVPAGHDAVHATVAKAEDAP